MVVVGPIGSIPRWHIYFGTNGQHVIRFNIFHPTECEKQGNILTQVELRYVALEGLSDDIKLPPPSPHPQLAVRFKVPFEQTMWIIFYICKAGGRNGFNDANKCCWHFQHLDSSSPSAVWLGMPVLTVVTFCNNSGSIVYFWYDWLVWVLRLHCLLLVWLIVV